MVSRCRFLLLPVFLLLISQQVRSADYGIKQTGGKFNAVRMRFGEAIESPIAGGYQSGRYGSMSRSPAIIAAAMATLKGGTLADAIGKLTEGQPHGVSPSLLAEISELLRMSM